MFSDLKVWWTNFTRKQRWKRVYREASPVDGVPNLYLSICLAPKRESVGRVSARVWGRLPESARDSLLIHWKKLQQSWDRRQTGIPLHIPIYGVFDSGLVTAPDFGDLIGRALKARQWNNHTDSGDGLMKLFAGIFLPLYESQTNEADVELHVARRFANYFLWKNEQGKQSNFVLYYHDDTDELLTKWGFQAELAREG